MCKLKDKPWLRRSIIISIAVGALIALGPWLKRKFSNKTLEDITESGFFQHSVTGLSHAEVEARQSNARAEARLLAEKQIQKEQLKRRVFSIFNITLLVMFITQLLTRDFWGALGTLGALILNVLVTAFNQYRSSKQVGKLLSAARPQATVIREGVLSNIDQDLIVMGDALIVGKGDEILSDGIILESSDFMIDATPYDLTATIEVKAAGDHLPAGSYCESGWAIFQVEHIKEKVDEDQLGVAATPVSEVKTPLQKGIQTMMLVLLGIAGIFYAILLVEFFRLDYLPSELVEIYKQALSIIFSIAPAGLIFMVIINYAIGSANIAKAGALIKSSHTIEELARITRLLLVRKRNLDSLSLEIELIPDAAGEFSYTESSIRQVLGNYVYSIPSMQFPFSLIKEELEGSRYLPKQQARFFSVLGWEAMSFDADYMQGTYVIGYPEFMQRFLEHGHLPGLEAPLQTDAQDDQSGLKARITNLWSRVKPGRAEAESEENEHLDADAQLNLGQEQSRWQRFKSRFSIDSKREDQTSEEILKNEGTDGVVVRLLFAYSPAFLSTTQATPQPPGDLVPLCYLNVVESHRSDMKQALTELRQAGVALKMLASGEIHNIEGLAKGLDIEDKNIIAAHIISGTETEESIANGDFSGLCNKTVYYQHNTEQMTQVIDLLNGEGHHVALQTNAYADIPLMSHANINISTKGSSHRVISKSDVVLMASSPSILPTIFKMGQNIVQSVINLLKLNLTQIGYVLLLIIAMFIIGSRRFVYEPIHGSIIGIVTIAVPSFFISLWTNSLKAGRGEFRYQLGMFIVPPMVTITLAVVGTFLYFNGRGYAFFRIQHIATHLLILIGLLLVVFCYPPIRLLSWDGKYVSDWRMTWVSLVLFVLLNALTFLPLFQRYLRLFPLLAFRDYLAVWAVGLGWALITLFVWRIAWKWIAHRLLR